MELAIAATQTCRSCGETKPIEEFDVRADTGKRKTQCKDCRRKYQNERNARLDPHEPRPARVAGTTELLRCTRCGELKPAEAFPRKQRAGPALQPWCRQCFHEVHAAHYAADRDRVKARVADGKVRRKIENTRLLEDHARRQGCSGCGARDTALLRLVDQRGRVRTISVLAGSGKWSRIEAELSTYVVRCANCIAADRSAAAQSDRRRRTLPLPPVNSSSDVLRRCGRCGQQKPLDAFVVRYRDLPWPSTWCRDCRAAYHREWYRRNRDVVIQRVRSNRDRAPSYGRTIAFIETRRSRWEFLLTHPCVDCGESNPLVLEFDHRGDKRAGINELLRTETPWSEISLEIEKCDVRCANCHRRRTAVTRRYHRDLLDPATRASAPENRRLRWEYLLAHPCVDCGESDPLVLEFDHREDKRAQIVDLMRNHAQWSDVLKEIEKCDVRCANCHRRRTAKVRGHYRELAMLAHEPYTAISDAQEEMWSACDGLPRSDPGGPRSLDLQIRSLPLCPTELRGHERIALNREPARIRTADPLLRRQVLSPLSYRLEPTRVYWTVIRDAASTRSRRVAQTSAPLMV